MERIPNNQPIATLGKIAAIRPPSGQLLLPPPPATWVGRVTGAINNRWNALRNSARLTVEDHMIAAPVIALATGFLVGRILNAVLSKPRYDARDW